MSTLIEEFKKCWLIAIFGCILFLGGIVILFWNEGRAVDTIISLEEALGDAVTLDPEDDIKNSYDGRIIHIRGPIILGEPLTEPDYNIQILAVKLKRRVQMYQWIEETIENNYGQSVSMEESEDRKYYYVQDWRDNIIDSRSFYIQTKHKNPDKFPIESQIQVADSVTIGKYELGGDVKKKFNKFMDLTSDSRPEDPSIKLHLGLYYHSNDVFNPEIGDLRILFSFAGLEGELYTIVGKSEKGKIVPYKTSRNTEILLVYPGEWSIIDIFKKEHHEQRLTTWSFRFIGWVLLFFGATCTASLLNIILSRAHFLSRLAPDPLFPLSANIILSFSLALIITSLAWFYHRPWIGTGLLCAALSPFFYCARSVTQYQRIS